MALNYFVNNLLSYDFMAFLCCIFCSVKRSYLKCADQSMFMFCSIHDVYDVQVNCWEIPCINMIKCRCQFFSCQSMPVVVSVPFIRNRQ